MTGVVLIGVSFVGAVLLEVMLLWVARRAQWLAHPNERSSHSTPTPTAGGIAIVLPVLAYLTVLPWEQHPAALGLFLGGSLIALVSLWDDLNPLGRRVRLGAQVVAAMLIIWGFQVQAQPGAAFLEIWALGWSWWVIAIALPVLLWHTNLFNFMDGIDGIAATQCIVLCVGVQLLAGGMSGWTGELAWVCAGATLGFLLFNWPPARIFMGDVGSAFLGLTTGFVVIDAFARDGVPLVSSFILLAVFWFDASYTLYVRMTGGQAFTEAHRSHLYQKLAARKGHLWTTGMFLLFACGYLLPLAWVAAEMPSIDWLMLLLAVGPLLILARRYRAGEPETPDAR